MNAMDHGRSLYATFKYVELTLPQRPEDDPAKWSGEVETVCTIYDDELESVVAEGTSRKSPVDQFSRKRGREIALGRACWKIYPQDAVKRHELLRQFLSK